MREYVELAIRLIPSGLKLIFLLYLGKIQGGVLLGEYALIASGIAIFIIGIGFEINAETSRLINNHNKKFRQGVIFSFILSIFILSILGLPFLFLLLENFSLFIGVPYIFIGLAFTSEYFCTEIFRLMVMLNRRRDATYFHFLRISPALLLPVLFDYFGIFSLSINMILISIVIFNFLSICYAYKVFLRDKNYLVEIKLLYDLLMICGPIMKKLFWGAKYFYIVSIASTLVAYFDKFLINNFWGIDAAGKYFLLSNIAGVYSMLISFTIGMKEAPKLLYFYGIKSRSEFIHEYEQYNKKLFVTSVILSFFVLISFEILSNIFYPLLKQYLFQFLMILAGTVITSFAILNRTLLLLTRSDLTIFFANVFPGSAFLIIIYILNNSITLDGVCAIFMISSTLQWLIFYVAARINLNRIKSENNSI